MVANILLYMPLGFFCMLTLAGDRRIRRPLRFVTICGVSMSLAMELGQFFDEGRVTSMSDLFTNGTGTFLGALAARMAGPEIAIPFAPAVTQETFPALLILAWFGYRLYPYVPTIDLHKYWHALWPAIRVSELTLGDLFRFSVSWSVVAGLAQRMAGRARGGLAYALLCGVEITGKIFILNNALKLADLIGMIAGYSIWRRMRSRRRPELAMAWALAAMIAAQRLLPLDFGPYHAFGWIPFRSFMHGSIGVNTQSFLEKFFDYGGVLWALIAAGLSLPRATTICAAALFAAGLAETVLAGRSAEITDAVMVVAIAFLYRTLDRRARENRGATGAIAGAAEPSRSG
jgi:hypothetical protein